MLREATPADLEFVHRLYMDDSINPYIAYDPMPIGEFAPLYDGLREQTQFLIWEHGGEALGMAQVQRGTHRFTHSAHLGGIAILPGRQGQGLGTLLMQELLGMLEREKFVRIELCVSADNPQALSCYEKLGFEREGTMRQYFSRAGHEGYVDEHMMAKILA